MLLVHKTQLSPNKTQETFFEKSAGIARFTYNWALSEWKSQHESGKKVSESKLRKLLNSKKKEQFPWMYEVSKTVPQQAIKNVGLAFNNFFGRVKTGGNPGYPRFKKKGKSKDSFKPDNGSTKDAGALNIKDKKVRIPRLGWVKMTESLRFEGKIIGSTISRTADRWFISISVQTEDLPHARENQGVCGIDLGVSKLATLDSGKTYFGAKSLAKNHKKLVKLSRQHSRKKKGSQNKKKSAIKLARLHYKIACIRSDVIHKATTEIVLNNSVIVMEDLNVRRMVKNHCLAKTVSDASMSEFKRQI